MKIIIFVKSMDELEWETNWSIENKHLNWTELKLWKTKFNSKMVFEII